MNPPETGRLVGSTLPPPTWGDVGDGAIGAPPCARLPHPDHKLPVLGLLDVREALGEVRQLVLEPHVVHPLVRLAQARDAPRSPPELERHLLVIRDAARHDPAHLLARDAHARRAARAHLAQLARAVGARARRGGGRRGGGVTAARGAEGCAAGERAQQPAPELLGVLLLELARARAHATEDVPALAP
eukprot:5121399-Prymnesium_polylepis.1